MHFHLQPTLAVTIICASSLVMASTSDSTSSSTHSYRKRELSDSSYNRLAIIHASVGSAATMLIFPLGVLGARGLRVITAKWWWAHAVLQGFFGLGCIIAAFVLGVILVGDGPDFESGHRRTGLVLLILVVVQAIVGVALKLFARTRLQKDGRMPGVKGHPVQNIVHVFNGLAILGLGFYQTWSGFSLIEQGSNGALVTPLVVYVLWGMIVGVVTALYLAGLGLLPLQFHKEEERRDEANLFYGEKIVRPSRVDIVEGYDAAGTGLSAVPMAQSDLRNRYYTSDDLGSRSNAVALATPVDVQPTSTSSLEQEIMDRQRRTSTAPLISRY
ncbi:hypothetical protein NCC49_002850 [Naganishia albida]|nr:hypothetical protein NCC49_002850 [Naganishia albida]